MCKSLVKCKNCIKHLKKTLKTFFKTISSRIKVTSLLLLYFISFYWIIIHFKGDAYIFSCDQAALWMVQSLCLSVHPSLCLSVSPSVTPFSLRSHHQIIMKVSGVITKIQFNCFGTIILVWIDVWQWNDVQSLMLRSRGALWFFKII